MGFALYHLDREGEAAEYFLRTLNGNPYDSLRDDTKKLLDDCYKFLAFPRYAKGYFAERVEKAWAAFAEHEAELRRLVDEGAPGEEIQQLAFSSLQTAFPDLSFEIGAKNYHIILSAGGTWMLYLLFRYFLSRMPESVRAHWKFSIGRKRPPRSLHRFRRRQDFGRRSAGAHHRRRRWRERECRSLPPLVARRPKPRLVARRSAGGQCRGRTSQHRVRFEDQRAGRSPGGRNAIKLSELREVLAQRYGNDPRWENIDVILQGTMNYRFKERDDIEPEDLRFDIISGTTSMPRLVGEFARGESGLEDLLHRFGCVGGFFAFDVPGLNEMPEAEREAAIDEACTALENYIRTHVEGNCVDFIGRAVGRFHVYVDFIAYDLEVCNAAFAFFENYDTTFAAFQTYRRDVTWYNMKKRK